jgi:hypothetical protein
VRDLKKTAANIPFVGNAYKTDKVDAWGNKEDQGNWMERTFNAFVNPGTIKKISTDPVEQEISRLNDAQTESVTPPTASKTISYKDKQGEAHNNVRLTEEQYQTLATEQGQTAKRILDKMIQTTDYKALEDEQKAKAIQQVYSYARMAAEIAAIGEDHTGFDEAWMEDMEEGKEAEFILRKVAGNDISNAMQSLQTAWKKGYSTDSRSDKLEWAYDAFKAMPKTAREEAAEWASGTAADYIEAREQGVGHDDIVSTYKLLQGITKNLPKAEAISKASGLTEQEKVVLVKQQVSETQSENIDQLKTMGYDIADYVKLYRDVEEYTSGTGKKKRTAAKWAKEYNISMDAAYKLYEVFK